MLLSVLVAAALALPAPPVQPAPRARPPAGTWANPSRSVRVRFGRCGSAVCGTVVWASDKARADAARGGTDRLVGTTLFRDLVEDAPGRWSGAVFVPDIGRTVEGTITQLDPRTLEGEGCLFAGLGCQRQTWTRVR